MPIDKRYSQNKYKGIDNSLIERILATAETNKKIDEEKEKKQSLSPYAPIMPLTPEMAVQTQQPKISPIDPYGIGALADLSKTIETKPVEFVQPIQPVEAKQTDIQKIAAETQGKPTLLPPDTAAKVSQAQEVNEFAGAMKSLVPSRGITVSPFWEDTKGTETVVSKITNSLEKSFGKTPEAVTRYRNVIEESVNSFANEISMAESSLGNYNEAIHGNKTLNTALRLFAAPIVGLAESIDNIGIGFAALSLPEEGTQKGEAFIRAIKSPKTSGGFERAAHLAETHDWSKDVENKLKWVGSMAPLMTLSAAGVPSFVTTALHSASAAGQALTRATKEGASLDAAMSYAVRSAGARAVIFNLTQLDFVNEAGAGVLGETTSKLLQHFIKNQTTLDRLLMLTDILGKGVETSLLTAIDPHLRRITYDPNAMDASIAELASSFVTGATLAAISHAVRTSQIKKRVKENDKYVIVLKHDANGKPYTVMEEYHDSMESSLSSERPLWGQKVLGYLQWKNQHDATVYDDTMFEVGQIRRSTADSSKFHTYDGLGNSIYSSKGMGFVSKQEYDYWENQKAYAKGKKEGTTVDYKPPETSPTQGVGEVAPPARTTTGSPTGESPMLTQSFATFPPSMTYFDMLKAEQATSPQAFVRAFPDLVKQMEELDKQEAEPIKQESVKQTAQPAQEMKVEQQPSEQGTKKQIEAINEYIEGTEVGAEEFSFYKTPDGSIIVAHESGFVSAKIDKGGNRLDVEDEDLNANEIPQPTYIEPTQEQEEPVQEAVGKEEQKAIPVGQAQTQTQTQTQPEEKLAKALPPNIERASPQDILVDADVYQFKRETDSEGVSTLLKNVDKWDENKAGVVLVHERLNGDRYIVNGHHRLELAKRLGVEGIDIRILKESDGITTEDARRIGAMANIAEGRGSAVDVAKVFRDSGITKENIRDEGLSLSENLVDKGYGISKLSDNLFDAVVNKDLAEATGALIGSELTGREDLQEALYKLLKKREARGKYSTEAFVRQAINMLKQSEIKQVDAEQFGLFGEQTEEYTSAEAKIEIVSRVADELRRIRNTFAPLTKENKAKAIKQGGNILSDQENQATYDFSNRAIDELEKTAFATGSRYSEAINKYVGDVFDGNITDREAAVKIVEDLRGLDNERQRDSDISSATDERAGTEATSSESREADTISPIEETTEEEVGGLFDEQEELAIDSDTDGRGTGKQEIVTDKAKADTVSEVKTEPAKAVSKETKPKTRVEAAKEKASEITAKKTSSSALKGLTDSQKKVISDWGTVGKDYSFFLNKDTGDLIVTYKAVPERAVSPSGETMKAPDSVIAFFEKNILDHLSVFNRSYRKIIPNQSTSADTKSKVDTAKDKAAEIKNKKGSLSEDIDKVTEQQRDEVKFWYEDKVDRESMPYLVNRETGDLIIPIADDTVYIINTKGDFREDASLYSEISDEIKSLDTFMEKYRFVRSSEVEGKPQKAITAKQAETIRAGAKDAPKNVTAELYTSIYSDNVLVVNEGNVAKKITPQGEIYRAGIVDKALFDIRESLTQIGLDGKPFTPQSGGIEAAKEKVAEIKTPKAPKEQQGVVSRMSVPDKNYESFIDKKTGDLILAENGVPEIKIDPKGVIGEPTKADVNFFEKNYGKNTKTFDEAYAKEIKDTKYKATDAQSGEPRVSATTDKQKEAYNNLVPKNERGGTTVLKDKATGNILIMGNNAAFARPDIAIKINGNDSSISEETIELFKNTLKEISDIEEKYSILSYSDVVGEELPPVSDSQVMIMETLIEKMGKDKKALFYRLKTSGSIVAIPEGSENKVYSIPRSGDMYSGDYFERRLYDNPKYSKPISIEEAIKDSSTLHPLSAMGEKLTESQIEKLESIDVLKNHYDIYIDRRSGDVVLGKDGYPQMVILPYGTAWRPQRQLFKFFREKLQKNPSIFRDKYRKVEVTESIEGHGLIESAQNEVKYKVAEGGNQSEKALPDTVAQRDNSESARGQAGDIHEAAERIKEVARQRNLTYTERADYAEYLRSTKQVQEIKNDRESYTKINRGAYTPDMELMETAAQKHRLSVEFFTGNMKTANGVDVVGMSHGRTLFIQYDDYNHPFITFIHEFSHFAKHDNLSPEYENLQRRIEKELSPKEKSDLYKKYGYDYQNLIDTKSEVGEAVFEEITCDILSGALVELNSRFKDTVSKYMSDVGFEGLVLIEAGKSKRALTRDSGGKSMSSELQKILQDKNISLEEYHVQNAVDEFGYTSQLSNAGFILTDGKSLNFGQETKKAGAERTEDHRAISSVFHESEHDKGDSATDLLVRFMNEGNIRVVPEVPGIDLGTKKPTPQQINTIKRYIASSQKDGLFIVDFSDERGRPVGSSAHSGRLVASRIINEINDYYDNGIIPTSDAKYKVATPEGKLLAELDKEWNEGGEVEKSKQINQGEGGKDTSRKQVAAGMRHFIDNGFIQKGDVVFENGAGVFDKAQLMFNKEGITHIPVDPYNRSARRNIQALEALKDKGGAKLSIMTNVLNVIKDMPSALQAINMAYAPLVPGGKMMITVYEKNKSGVWDGSQKNRPLEWYKKFIAAAAPDAKITQENGMLIATKPESGTTSFPEYVHGFTQIGKNENGYVYVHKDYVDDSIMTKKQKEAAHTVLSKLSAKEKETYNLIAVQSERGLSNENMVVQVQESPDFDTADEPSQARVLKFDFDGNRIKGSVLNPSETNPRVLHGKHLWVGEDYKGFDRVEAEKRYSGWQSSEIVKQYKDIKGDGKSVAIGLKNQWNDILEKTEMELPKYKVVSKKDQEALKDDIYKRAVYLAKIDPSLPSNAGKAVQMGDYLRILQLAATPKDAMTDAQWMSLFRVAEKYSYLLKDQDFTNVKIGEDPEDRIASVLTEKPKDKMSLKERWEDATGVVARAVYDQMYNVDKLSKKLKDPLLYQYLANARQTTAAGQFMIGVEQRSFKDRSKVVGKGLKPIFEPIYEMDRLAKKADKTLKGNENLKNFFTYLYHEHNVDRMSIVERANEKLKSFLKANPAFTAPDISALANHPEMPTFMYLSQKVLNAVDKPVFSEKVTAKISRQTADAILQANPEFEAVAQDLYKYLDNLLQYRVDSGLISADTAYEVREMYPHYVPTYRVPVGTAGSKVQELNSIGIDKEFKGATGSNRDLMPIDEIVSQQTLKVVSAATRNEFGNRLMNLAAKNTSINKEVSIKGAIKNLDAPLDIDTFDDFISNESLSKEKGSIYRIYKDGEAVELILSDGMYAAVESVSANSLLTKALNHPVLSKTIIPINETFKKLTTGWAPSFLARNPVRDYGDLAWNSQNLRAWHKHLPEALKEIRTNGEMWRLYQSVGGLQISYYDFDKGIEPFRLADSKMGAVLAGVETLNMYGEHYSRFTEFLAILNGNKNPDYNLLMKAINGAAEVTVDFGKAGWLVRALNRTIMPYFNPQVQGAIKTFTVGKRYTQSARGIATALAKIILLGILPSAFNELLPKLLDMMGIKPDSDEYSTWEESYAGINEREKDINYVIPSFGGQYVKLPKGHFLGTMGAFYNRSMKALQGDKKAFEGFGDVAYDNIGIPNPLTATIFEAGIATFGHGKTFFGTDIESQRLQNIADVTERYDESTDYLSRGLSKILIHINDKASPKRINYMLKQYSGVVGEYLLPLISPKGKDLSEIFFGRLKIDPVTNNKYGNEFYSAREDLATAVRKEENRGNKYPAEALVSRYMANVAKEANSLYSEIRDINNSDLPNAQKVMDRTAAQKLLNALQKNAVEILPDFQKAVEKELAKVTIVEDEAVMRKAMDRAYYNAYNEIFGAEHALAAMGKDVIQKAEGLREEGVTFEQYFKHKTETEDNAREKEAYYESQGKTVPNYEKSLLVEDILNLNATDSVMAALYADKYETADTPYEKRISYALDNGISVKDVLKYEAEKYKLVGESVGGKQVANTDLRDKVDYLLKSGMSDKAMQFIYQSQIENIGAKTESTMKAALDNGVSTKDYLEAVKNKWLFSSDNKDEFGNTIAGEAKAKAADFVLGMKTTDEAKKWLFSNTLGYTGDVVEYGKAKTLLKDDKVFNSLPSTKQRDVLFDTANYYIPKTAEEKEATWQTQYRTGGASDAGITWSDYKQYREYVDTINPKTENGKAKLQKWFQNNKSATLTKEQRNYLYSIDAPNRTVENGNIKAAEIAKIDPAQYIAYAKHIGTIDAKDASGKSVSGLKKERTVAFVKTLPLTAEQKAIMLYLTTTSKFPEYESIVKNYISKLTASKEEKELLAEMVGLIK